MGPCVTLFAPGVNITSLYHGNRTFFISFSGTSTSTPHVTGVAAIILSVKPYLTPLQLKQEIVERASVRGYLTMPSSEKYRSTHNIALNFHAWLSYEQNRTIHTD